MKRLQSLPIIAALTLATIVITTFASCSKDGDGGDGPTDYYTFNGKKVGIEGAYWAWNDVGQDSYMLYLTSAVLTGSDVSLGDEMGIAQYLHVMVPVSSLGKSVDFGDDPDDFLWAYVYSNGDEYDAYSSGGSDRGYDFSGTVQVSKNSGNNFTVKFDLTIDGKKIKCNYTGDFVEKIFSSIY